MNLGMTVAEPGTVLPVLLSQLRASNTVIGALPAIRFGGWLLPQLFVAGYLQGKPRKRGFVVLLDLARALAYLVIAALLVTRERVSPSLLLTLFLVLFGITRVTAGSSMVGRFDVIGKVIAREKLAHFYASRGFWTGLGGLIAGLFIAAVLGSGLRFPVGYAVLFVTSAAIFTIGAWAFRRVREGPSAGASIGASPLAQIGRIPSMLSGDPLYRRFLIYRALLEMASVAGPFYILYAIESWRIPTAMAGTYVAAATAAAMLANLYWRRMARRQGNTVVLVRSVQLGVLVPLVPVLVGLLPRGSVTLGGPAVAIAFLVLFALDGASSAGRDICNNAVLLNLAPDAERPSYLGLTNTLVGPLTLLTIAAGRSVDHFGYQPVFVFALVLSIATWWGARAIRERDPEACPVPAMLPDAPAEGRET